MLIEVEPGVRLFVSDIGSRDDVSGPPVVFVAGFGLDHTLWARESALFAASRRVVCLDQRGHGASDKPGSGYGIDRLATDLLLVLDTLEIARCDLVGWSFGGQTSFRVAQLAPQRVRRLVLVASNGVRASRSERFPFGRDPQAALQAMMEGELRDRAVARHASIASAFGEQQPDPEVLQRLVEISMAMPSEAALACYHTMFHADLLSDIDRVAMPVLQLLGDRDPVPSAKGASWLQQRLPDSRLVELANCAHYPMLEAAEAFDLVLWDFLR